MTRALVLAIVGALSSAAAAQTNEAAVERLDPALDALVSADAKVELVKGGFGFTEGPVWVQQGREGYLLFTDIPGNVIWKLTLDGKASVYLEPGRLHRSGGLALGRTPEQWPRAQRSAVRGIRHDRRRRPDARSAGPADRRHLRGPLADAHRYERRRTVLADRYEGKRFGGPNDVVVKRDGAIYFTDTYGAFRLREKDPRRELDFNAVYRWKDGKLTLRGQGHAGHQRPRLLAG